MDSVPPELVISFDQTALNYVPIPDWTMEKEGTKRVEIIAKDDKRQPIAVFAGSATGEFLPLQLIYGGKTDRCLPHYNFLSSWHITKTLMHWSNEHTMKEYFTEIILLYVNKKKRTLKLSSEQPAFLIFDNFKTQCTSSFLTLLDANKINVVMIPPNCTDRLHTAFRFECQQGSQRFLRGQFREWYAKQVCSQLDGQNAVNLRLSVLKPLGAVWINSMHACIHPK